MKNVIFNSITVISLILVMAILGPFKLSTAFSEYKDYTSTMKKINSVNDDMDKAKDKISASRKKLQEIRGASAVDLEDANALYEAVTSLDGVEEKSALLLRIADGTTSVRADYDENNKDIAKRADGIQITVKVKDISLYMRKFNSLKIPVESLNIVYPENRIIVILNTKGGQL